MNVLRPEEPVVTATYTRARLVRLERERAAAGRGEDAALIARLGADVAACRQAYVGQAVTEIASFRAQLSGPQVG
jgi:hypothetical protein